MDNSQEQWKSIPGYDKYEISNQGRVWSDYGKGRLLKPIKERTGHCHVSLHRMEHPQEWLPKVHLLVLEQFVGPRPAGMIGLHLDGDLANNKLDNLMWGAREGHVSAAKLTNKDVINIRERYSRGKANKEHRITLKELASEYGVSHPTILRVVHGMTYKNVP